MRGLSGATVRRVGARADSSASGSNVQRVGGDVGGLVPGQEQRGGAHLVHRAGAAEWRHRLGGSLIDYTVVGKTTRLSRPRHSCLKSGMGFRETGSALAALEAAQDAC